MTSPSVRVNTLFKHSEKTYVDQISRFYIVSESFLGLNRLPLLFNTWKYIVTFIAVAFSILFTAYLLYITNIHCSPFTIVMLLGFIEYIFCFVFSVATWKRTETYYCQLNKFDIEIGCRPKTAVASIRNVILMVLFGIYIVVFHMICNLYKPLNGVFITIIPLNLIHSMELFYYGHLLSLLTPRLRLINYYVESVLSTGKDIPRPKIEELAFFKHKDSKNCEVNKLMDLYHIVIKAYDFLIDAVKWQLLVVLITSFGITLNFCYQVSSSIINKPNPFLDIVSDMGIVAVEMLPLFSPCMFGDKVHNEVRRLREVLASRLYENKLDKPGRSAARALLSLTEARDLSFSLLRMLQIDISLPFKFIGLLVTYLIIWLQFDKVINSTAA